MTGSISIGSVYGILELRDTLSGGLTLAANRLDSFAAKTQKLGQTLSQVGDKMTVGLTLPLIAAGGAALRFSTQFERSMVQVVTVSGVAEGAARRMRDQILELGPATGQGPNALAKGLLVVTSTGLRGAEAMQILTQSAKATAAGLGDTKDVARTVTSAMTAYGKENLSAAKASDILFAAVREGGADADQFAGSLGRVVGIASQIGVSFEEVAASVATFTRLGVDADEAVTALRGTMSVILHPAAQTRDALRELGTSIQEVRDKIKKDGLTDALIDLVARSKGNEDAIGAIIPNIRALAGVLGNAGSQAKAYREILEKVTGSTGDLDRAFQRTTETGAFKIEQFWSRVQVLAIAAGDRLAPSLIRLLDASQPLFTILEKLIVLFGHLPTPLQTAAIALLALTVAAGPVMSWAGRLMDLFGGLSKVVLKLARDYGLLAEAQAATALVSAGGGAGSAAVMLTNVARAATATATAMKAATAEQMAFNFEAQAAGQALLGLSGSLEQTAAATATGATQAGVWSTAWSTAIAAVTGTVTGVGLLIAGVFAGGVIATAKLTNQTDKLKDSVADIPGVFSNLGSLLKSGLILQFNALKDSVTGLWTAFLGLGGWMQQQAPSLIKGLGDLLDEQLGRWKTFVVLLDFVAKKAAEMAAGGPDIGTGLALVPFTVGGTDASSAAAKRLRDSISGVRTEFRLADADAKQFGPTAARAFDESTNKLRAYSGGVNLIAEAWPKATAALDSYLTKQQRDWKALSFADNPPPPQFGPTFANVFQLTSAQAKAAVGNITPFTAAAKAAQDQLKALDATTRNELIAGIKMAGFSFEDWSKKALLIPGAAKLSDAALHLLVSQVQESGKALKDNPLSKLTKDLSELATKIQLTDASGLATQVKLFGEESFKAAEEGRAFGLEVPAGIKRVSGAWYDAQLAKGVQEVTLELAKMMHAWKETFGDNARAALHDSTDEWVKNEQAIHATAAEIVKVGIGFRPDTLINRLKAVTEQFQAQRDAIPEAERNASNYARRLAEMAKLELATRAQVTEAWLRANGQTHDDLRELAEDAKARFEAIAKAGVWSAETVQKAFDDWWDAEQKRLLDQNPFVRFFSTFQTGLKGIGDAMTQLAQLTGGKFSEIARWIGTIAIAFDQAAEAGKRLSKGISELGKKGTRAQGVADLAVGIAGGVGAIASATRSDSTKANVAGGAVTGAALGLAIGSNPALIAATGGASIIGGLLIGAAAGAIIGYFRSKNDWKQISKQVGAETGINISKNLAKEIADLSKTLEGGTKQQRRELATLFSLDKIIEEGGGLNAANTGMFELQAHKLFDSVTKGGKEGGLAIKTLNDLVGQFAAQAEKTGGLWDVAFISMIDRSKELGLNLEEVNKAIDTQITKLGKGLGLMTTSFSTTIEQTFMGGFKGSGLPTDVTQGLFDALGDPAKMAEAMKKFVEAQKDSQKELEKSLLKQYGVEMTVATTATAGAGAAIDALQRKLADANLDFREAQNDVARLTEKLNTMRGSGKYTAAQLQDVALQIERAAFKAETAQSSIATLAQKLKELGGTAGGTQIIRVLPPDIQKQLEASGADPTAILKAIVAQAQPEFNRLSRIALASFNTIIARGRSAFDAIQTIGDSVDQLITVYDKLHVVVAPTTEAKAWEGFTDVIKSFSQEQQHILEHDYELARAAGKVTGTYEDFVRAQAQFYQTLQEGDPRLLTSFLGADFQKFLDFQAKAKQSVEGVGLAANAAFEELRRWRTLTVDNADLIASVAGLNDVMVALANLGGLDADVFADLQAQGEAAFAQLQSVGFTETESLAAMVPYLQTIISLHNERGLAIDEATQKMIDDAVQQGLIAKDQISTNDVLMLGLSAIIDALGGKLPAAFEAFRQAGIDAAQKVKNEMDKIPTDINTTVTVSTVNGPNGPGDYTPSDTAATGGFVSMGRVLPFAAGGMVEARSFAAGGAIEAQHFDVGGMGRLVKFVPKGIDVVPAMLAEGEGVVNRGGMRRIGEGGLSAINHGGWSNIHPRDSGPTEISVRVDLANATIGDRETAETFGEVVGESVGRKLAEELRKGGSVRTVVANALTNLLQDRRAG